jgi:hypothetical protein
LTRRRGCLLALAAALCVAVCLPAPKTHGGRLARITHYWDTGEPMADGEFPFIGAAACSSDIGFKATVVMENGDTYRCLDTGLLDGWGYSRIDVYGFDAEAVYGEWAEIAIVGD